MEPGQPAKGREQRQGRRSRTRLVAIIRDVDRGERGRAVTKNLSVKGMCVLSQQVLRAGSLVELELTLPDRQQPLALQGRVVWNRPLDAATAHEEGVMAEVGIAFAELSREELVIVRGIAALYALPEFLETPPPAA